MTTYKELNELVEQIAKPRKIKFLEKCNYKIPKGYLSRQLESMNQESHAFSDGSVKPETVYKPRNKYDKTPIWRIPRVLGKEFRTVSESKDLKIERNSPRSHWRIGHWRRVPIGKREKNERKWIWIEPVYVGKQNY